MKNKTLYTLLALVMVFSMILAACAQTTEAPAEEPMETEAAAVETEAVVEEGTS